VAALCGSADSPWSEAHAGKAITENWLCRQLRRFGIDSHNVRMRSGRRKGLSWVILRRHLRGSWEAGERRCHPRMNSPPGKFQ
jgi:hypothetical protein